MQIKKIGLAFLILITCQIGFAQNPLGQALQINTQFNKVCGKPDWLLIVREQETGRVIPYYFEIRNNDNYWLSFTYGRSYKITASILKYGPITKINNFCHLENGIITGKSMIIRLTGVLSPNPRNFCCNVTAYPDTLFPIVDT